MSTQQVEKESITPQTFLHRSIERLTFILDQFAPVVINPITARTAIKIVKEVVDQIEAEMENHYPGELVRSTIDFIQMKINDLIDLMLGRNNDEIEDLMEIIQGNLYMFLSVLENVDEELELLSDNEPKNEAEENNETKEESKNSLDDLTPVEDD